MMGLINAIAIIFIAVFGFVAYGISQGWIKTAQDKPEKELFRIKLFGKKKW